MPAYKGEHEDVIRPFVDSMRYKLAVNRHKGTSADWEKLDPDALLKRLADEVEELREAIAGGNCTEIMLEGADIANFAMIISYIAIRRAAAGKGSTGHGAAPATPRGGGDTERGSGAAPAVSGATVAGQPLAPAQPWSPGRSGGVEMVPVDSEAWRKVAEHTEEVDEGSLPAETEPEPYRPLRTIPRF